MSVGSRACAYLTILPKTSVLISGLLLLIGLVKWPSEIFRGLLGRGKNRLQTSVSILLLLSLSVLTPSGTLPSFFLPLAHIIEESDLSPHWFVIPIVAEFLLYCSFSFLVQVYILFWLLWLLWKNSLYKFIIMLCDLYSTYRGPQAINKTFRENILN